MSEAVFCALSSTQGFFEIIQTHACRGVAAMPVIPAYLATNLSQKPCAIES
ncbi:hypothetical protein [Caballeronia hypogeia]|uniref:hypothetical protein n=1 Tax=Caballeronia hypogeia TaxID=1777140 RepID=UPI000B05AA7B|nr:hypothetical protein [Caballeronia hypogeia]